VSRPLDLDITSTPSLFQLGNDNRTTDTSPRERGDRSVCRWSTGRLLGGAVHGVTSAGSRKVVSSAASWSGASSAMWCPLSMGAPRRSMLQGAQTARTSPYSSCMSSPVDHSTSVGR